RQYWYKYGEYSCVCISSHRLSPWYPSHNWHRSGLDHSASQTDHASRYDPVPYFQRFWTVPINRSPITTPAESSHRTSTFRVTPCLYNGQYHGFYNDIGHLARQCCP